MISKAPPSRAGQGRSRARCVSGPVSSRRFGRSLGVDLVAFKTCTYDCIYCQLGRTTCKTVQRQEWVPLEEVLDELKEKLTLHPDYVTLSGSGEPTLYFRLGELIGRIRSMTDIPLAVLTNGSLLWQEEVRRQLMDANLVIPSLDAGDASMFNVVNRPHPEIDFERMLYGLIEFRGAYRGEYWLEALLLDGYTAIPVETQKIVECVRRIRPDRVQLNTVTRSPAESCAAAVDREGLLEFAATFDPPAEVIAGFHDAHPQDGFRASCASVLDMLRRRPCSIEDIANGLGLHRNEASEYIQELSAKALVDKMWSNGALYYRVVTGSGNGRQLRGEGRRSSVSGKKNVG